jgi:hypothetical protein
VIWPLFGLFWVRGLALDPVCECILIRPFSFSQHRAWNCLLAVLLLAGTIIAAKPVFAQNDLGPVAAPTTSVSVSTLPVVRSESQQITDYARGLFEGLLAREEISHGALVIISRDRVDMAEVLGDEVGENALFALGSLSDLFGVVSVMQLTQAARLFPAEDLAAALGEQEPRGDTLGELLSQRLDDSSDLLASAVEHASGMPYEEHISSQILEPLGMARSRFELGVGMLVTAGDMSRFLSALIGRDGAGGENILLPATRDLMQRGHYSRHPALPGWSYGLAEMYRNGWRALHRDGVFMEASLPQSRIVVIPELQIAYFISVSSLASPEFWQTLDANLFDRLAPHRVAPGNLRTSPAPSQQDAAQVAGLYRPRIDPDEAVFLRTGGDFLRVAADGAMLRLSGAETLALQPISGGAWQSQEDLIPAAFIDGVFWFGSAAYLPVRSWQKPGNYLLAAGILGIFTALMLAAQSYAPGTVGLGPLRRPEIVYGLVGLTAILIGMAVVLHSWS